MSQGTPQPFGVPGVTTPQNTPAIATHGDIIALRKDISDSLKYMLVSIDRMFGSQFISIDQRIQCVMGELKKNHDHVLHMMKTMERMLQVVIKWDIDWSRRVQC